MEMFTVQPRHSAVTMAHIFAKADVRDYHQLRTFRLDRTNRFLDDAMFSVGAASLFVFLFGNTEQDNGL